MNIAYNDDLLAFIDVAKTTFPGRVKDDDGRNWPHGLYGIVYEQIKLLPELVSEQKRLGVQYGCYISFNTKLWATSATVNLQGSKWFQSRADMMDYAKELGIRVPKECDKIGDIDSDGNLTTLVMHKCELSDIVLTLMYTRAGLPTDKCKVEETVTRQVVCNLD